MSTADWMQHLDDKKWLRQIVMPGSHDAGVYGTAQTILRNSRFVKEQYVVCQHSNFEQQALAGSRFFDCRVFQQKIGRDASGNKQYAQKLGHFAMERKKKATPKMGGYGGALQAVVGQALNFVVSKPTEFVILRFSHTYHPRECIQEIKDLIASQPHYAGAVYKGTGNIATKPIGQLRGKVIMVFDEKFNKHITPGEGIHRFNKYSASAGHIDGLATCGTFSRSMKMSKVHAGAADAINKHRDHPGDPGLGHLHFVYWQQTAGVFGEKDIYRTTTAAPTPGQDWSGGAHQNLGKFMAEIAQMGRQASMPINVLSHDFVTADTCMEVIRLNPDVP